MFTAVGHGERLAVLGTTSVLNEKLCVNEAVDDSYVLFSIQIFKQMQALARSLTFQILR